MISLQRYVGDVLKSCVIDSLKLNLGKLSQKRSGLQSPLKTTKYYKKNVAFLVEVINFMVVDISARAMKL